MAEQALEIELRQETEFLARYDQITRVVNERFDLRDNDLATLVLSCLDNGGVVSNRKRKQFQDRVPAAAFECIEEMTRQTQTPPHMAEPHRNDNPPSL